jgi:excisionase family DNA binding protein
MNESERLWTVSEVAELLRLRAHTVYQYAREGRIPAVNLRGRVVRFSPGAIREWLEENSKRTKGEEK